MASSGSPLSPRLVSGGIVTMDPDTSIVQSVIALQYNPDSLTPQPANSSRSRRRRRRARRCPAPARAGRSKRSKSKPSSTRPISSSFLRNTRMPANTACIRNWRSLRCWSIPLSKPCWPTTRWPRPGTLEIIPLEQPLTLFVWSASRVVPVRLTEFSITEEAFDPNLNPIRAKVSLGMRVLSVDDLGFDSPGGRMFLTYLTNKETLAGLAPTYATYDSRTGRHLDELPARSHGAAGHCPACHLPDRQPLLRLRGAAVHRAHRARSFPTFSAASSRSPARPTTPPSTSTPPRRATAST